MTINMTPDIPSRKPYWEELNLENFHSEKIVDENSVPLSNINEKAERSMQTEKIDTSKAANSHQSATTSIILSRISGTRRNLATHGSKVDGSTTGTALAAIATGLDPLGKTSVIIPVGEKFDLGYDQVQAQNAGLGIFLSDAPKNTGTNKRRQAVNPSWGSPYMFAKTVFPRHLAKFHAACATGAATILIMGDSIFNAGANLANQQQNPWEHLVARIRAHNPGVTITDYNMTYGGMTWDDMASSVNGAAMPEWLPGQDGKMSWLNLCLNKKPNLVFLYSGGNDGYNCNFVNIDKVIKAFQEIGADVILCETYQPNTGSTIGNYYEETVQDGITYVRRFVTRAC